MIGREPNRGLAWDGGALREALAESATWVEAHAEALNALNVFPVPDGDTGYNLARALRAAAEEATRAPSDSLGDVATSMARGALMCPSAGNSGNVLAGLLRGMASQLEGSAAAGPLEMAKALREGANAAYNALERPVEGTILTVARCAADGAEQAANSGGNLLDVLEAAERSARLAVAQTPELLPILKEAKVVDAGGEGYRVFLEGLGFYARGEPVPAEEVPV
ncbi:MAG TPA: DAK2 domain-containing protein, partial [Chloroflexota bacterium]